MARSSPDSLRDPLLKVPGQVQNDLQWFIRCHCQKRGATAASIAQMGRQKLREGGRAETSGKSAPRCLFLITSHVAELFSTNGSVGYKQHIYLFRSLNLGSRKDDLFKPTFQSPSLWTPLQLYRGEKAVYFSVRHNTHHFLKLFSVGLSIFHSLWLLNFP